MYLIGRAEGWTGQKALRPMDLADATLVALAEERRITRILTLDADFAVYRVGRRRFEVVPA